MVEKYFVIFGERNSGTNYLEAILTGRSFFLDHPLSAFDLPVLNPSYDSDSKLENKFGSKHFFNHRLDQNIKDSGSKIIFIGIVRNPYDWIMALNRDKHHIPPENYDIKDFLSNEWYSIDHDKKSKTYGEELMEDRDFPSGLRYKNIFDLRKKKLDYLLNTMPKIATNYELVRYEDLSYDPWSIVTEWSNKYKLPLNMPFLPPKKRKVYEIESEIKQIIKENIDWEIEERLAYFK